MFLVSLSTLPDIDPANPLTEYPTESPIESPTRSFTSSPTKTLVESSTEPLSQYSTQSSTESYPESFTDTLRTYSDDSDVPFILSRTSTSSSPAEPADLGLWAETVKVVDPFNEQKIRTYHPVLSEIECVGVYEYPWVRKVWVIPSTGDPALDLSFPKEVAGRELHVEPVIVPLPNDMALDDPFPGNPLGPRSSWKRFSDATKRGIEEIFPNMVGIKILPCGVMTILFSSEEEVSSALAGPRPGTIGGLVCHLDVCPEAGGMNRVN